MANRHQAKHDWVEAYAQKMHKLLRMPLKTARQSARKAWRNLQEAKCPKD